MAWDCSCGKTNEDTISLCDCGTTKYRAIQELSKKKRDAEEGRAFSWTRAIIYAVLTGIALAVFSQYASLKNSITGFRPGAGAVVINTVVIILGFLYGGFRDYLRLPED